MFSRRWLFRWWWLVALLVFDVFFVIWWRGRDRQEALPVRVDVTMEVSSPPPPPLPVLTFGFPTAQTNLVDTVDETVYMPTASGRVQSALYGSVRTRNAGGRLLPSFHEGIDIAPRQRNRRGRSLDPVLAVADGTVAYANRVIGHSNYGRYVVLTHTDPVGEIYTLYAHLNSVDDQIRPGVQIRRGERLGIMGNTPSSIIPVIRSHLHFEIGMIQSRRFESWAKRDSRNNQHGRYHGWNLTGVDPMALYQTTAAERRFSMLAYLRALPVAWELRLTVHRPLDYFLRYPRLWEGEGEACGAIVLSVSEGGVILSGRPATPEERATGSEQRPEVLSAYPEVLDRNGLRYVIQRDGHWQLGRNGERWLDILTY